MKFATAVLWTLTCVSATPVLNQRNASPAAIDDAATKLDALQAKVEALSLSINKTISSMPSTTEPEKDALASAVAPQMKELEVALNETTSIIASSTAQHKRSASGSSLVDVRGGSCSDSCLVNKASGLVTIISGTVSGLVGCLGVDRVTILIKPVLASLTGLLTCLDGLVSGLLKTVTGVLGSLLGGLGLGDLLGGLLGGLLGDLLGGLLGGGSGGGLIGGLLGGLEIASPGN